jgi:hypothetical protein
MKKMILFPLLSICFCWLACYKEKAYLPTNVPADSVLVKVTSSDAALPADGLSFTFISAELPLSAVDNRSSVVFTTTRGTFDNNAKTITQAAVLVNDNGTNRRLARVKLIASSNVENADVTATVSNIAKTITVPFVSPAYDTYLTVMPSAGTMPADGASFVYLNVEQPLNVPLDNTSVVFTATSGTFDNGTKTITKSSTVTLVGGIYKRAVQVRFTSSKNLETAHIEVSTKSTLKATSVDFTKAFPESIKLSVGAPSIATGFANSVQVTTALSRLLGMPSVGCDATLAVTDTNNVVRGSFINYVGKSDGSGIVTNKFTLGTDTYKGKLNIIATTQDASGKVLIDKTQIIAQ